MAQSTHQHVTTVRAVHNNVWARIHLCVLLYSNSRDARMDARQVQGGFITLGCEARCERGGILKIARRQASMICIIIYILIRTVH